MHSNEQLSKRHLDRSRAWRWVRTIKADNNVWRLENFKNAMEFAEANVGLMPDPDLVYKANVTIRLKFIVGSLLGFILFFVMFFIPRGSSKLPTNIKRVVAIHGELSTRTRHVLTAVSCANPPVEGIILLGRLRNHAKQIVCLWANAGYRNLPPIIVPYNSRAFFSALADFFPLWKAGFQASGTAPFPLSLMSSVATCFRVLQGAVMARWWSQQSVARGCEVIFGIDGMADTTLFERAIRREGGSSAHAVHGQLIGPNLFGFADVTYFRSNYDAKMMMDNGGYGQLTYQPADSVAPKRGETGVLLLTNLAHPMNSDFRTYGPIYELEVLTAVAKAANQLGDVAHPLYWKPHPVIESLPVEQASRIRTSALALGWQELPSGTLITEVASTVRWVISTPSTVVVDLLQAGTLSLVVDPRGTLLDTAISVLPVTKCNAEDIANCLNELENSEQFKRCFNETWRTISPSRPLDLTYLAL